MTIYLDAEILDQDLNPKGPRIRFGSSTGQGQDVPINIIAQA